jgi:hypothetical protein
VSKTYCVELTVSDDVDLDNIIEALAGVVSDLEPLGSVVAYELDVEESRVVSVGALMFE